MIFYEGDDEPNVITSSKAELLHRLIYPSQAYKECDGSVYIPLLARRSESEEELGETLAVLDHQNSIYYCPAVSDAEREDISAIIVQRLKRITDAQYEGLSPILRSIVDESKDIVEFFEEEVE